MGPVENKSKDNNPGATGLAGFLLALKGEKAIIAPSREVGIAKEMCA
jgi:hypothetical protein